MTDPRYLYMVRIVAPHFVAGVTVEPDENGIIRVTEPAPILHYTRGWSIATLKAYMVRKGWQGTWILPEDP